MNSISAGSCLAAAFNDELRQFVRIESGICQDFVRYMNSAVLSPAFVIASEGSLNMDSYTADSR